jgi:hypothetical protein
MRDSPEPPMAPMTTGVPRGALGAAASAAVAACQSESTRFTSRGIVTKT